MQPFVLNRHDRIVFPSNFRPELDVSVIASLEQLDKVIRRDFETKAPDGSDILQRIKEGGYPSRYALMRDVALNLFWAGRFALTMYEKRAMRWADVPRRRPDIFMEINRPWEDGDEKIAAVREAYDAFPATWDAEAEDRIFTILFDAFGHRKQQATELTAVKPTIAEVVSDPTHLVFRLNNYDPDFPTFGYDDIIDCWEDVPELEALHRWAMVLHNQYPWARGHTELVEVGQLCADDHVVVLEPRNEQVRSFLRRLRTPVVQLPRPRRDEVAPALAYSPVNVRTHFKVMPRIEAISAVHGQITCTNEDLIRNTGYNWSPMSAAEIVDKTGIEQRLYSRLSLEELGLEAARTALAHAGREPGGLGGVIVATCTSTKLIPSVATWICGELGITQTHAAYDIVAACAGLPYGLLDATRLLQEVKAPVLLVCVEKFSDKIGNVRPSRMIFGDGAAAVVLGVAPEGAEPDIEYLQTFASGPASQVNSIIWPNSEFDNNITVYGPEVKALAGRYLLQMVDELKALPAPEGRTGNLLDSVDLIVPHQANKTMVTQLAIKAGLELDRVYFNIAKVGNASAASIPLAIHDAVRDGILKETSRIFAPGYGAGAVAGYAVLRVDPAVVVTSRGADLHCDCAVPSPKQPSEGASFARG
jgi:3-oxoacyl-[acyl-carrier-protein] synthase III